MKKILSLLSALLLAVSLFNGCQDRTDLTAPPAPDGKSGNVDFSRFVVIGNSLTAGYQSSALYESAQNYCFGNQIAQEVGADFAMPLISDPGIGGLLEVQSLEPFALTVATTQGTPTNLTYPAPYNNLGIPGALLYDVLNATSSTTCASYIGAGVANPFFDIVLRGNGSQFQQAKLLHPTVVVLWIGNNDVLGYATSGGAAPTAPTPVPQFQYLYSQLADSVASLGAKTVVVNIPDVTTIPFFTTVGPMVGLELPSIVKLYYQKHGETVASGQATANDLLTGKILLTLQGSEYAPLLGHPTGKWYRDHGYPALPQGIDTTKPFGFHPQNPWPDALTLDADEMANAESTVAAYNSTISAMAAKDNFGLVDINGYLKQVRAADFSGGTTINGVNFTTMFVEGGIFGLDGVHPTDRGQAIIANQIISVLNSKFGANLSTINVSTIPGSIVLAGSTSLGKITAKTFPPNFFKNLVF